MFLAGPPIAGVALAGEKRKNICPPPRKRRQAKNVYTNSKNLTLNCRVTWGCSERLNLYNRQIITQQRKGKNLRYTIGTQAPSCHRRDLGFIQVPHLLALVSCAWYSVK